MARLPSRLHTMLRRSVPHKSARCCPAPPRTGSLEESAPERARLVRERAREAVFRLSKDFPGDPTSGLLDEDEGEHAEQRFADFANDEPCPALDPATGLCELYESRPMTCRVFGPPVRSEDGLGVCELCFQGATDEEIAACEMNPDPDDLESTLVEEVEKTTGCARPNDCGILFSILIPRFGLISSRSFTVRSAT